MQTVTESSVAALLADRQHVQLASLTVISQISRTSGTDQKQVLSTGLRRGAID
jgi:hypothetical protein